MILNLGRILLFFQNSIKKKTEEMTIEENCCDEIKFYFRKHVQEGNRICDSNQNRTLHNTLRNVAKNQNIKNLQI